MPSLEENVARLSDDQVERLFTRLTRAVHRQSKFDADIAQSLVRILRGEERGIARGIGHELRKLIGEIAIV